MRTIGLFLLALSCFALAVPAQSQQRRAPRAKATAQKPKGPTKAEQLQKQRQKVEDQAVKEAIEDMKDANEKGKAREEQHERQRDAASDGNKPAARGGAANGPRGGAVNRPPVRAQRPQSPGAQRKREDRAWRLRLERDEIRRDSALQEREREKKEIKDLAKAEADAKAVEAPASDGTATKEAERAADKKVPVPPRAKPYGPRGKSKAMHGGRKRR